MGDEALDDSNEAAPVRDAPDAIYPPRLTRKAPKRQRPHVQRTRYSPEEKAELERRAGEAGYTVGAYCRASALGDAGPRARRRVPIDRELIARNTAQLNHIGSNLNQLARALNQIAIEEGNGRLAQVAEVLSPIGTTLDALRTTLAANRRALGYDSEG